MAWYCNCVKDGSLVLGDKQYYCDLDGKISPDPDKELAAQMLEPSKSFYFVPDEVSSPPVEEMNSTQDAKPAAVDSPAEDAPAVEEKAPPVSSKKAAKKPASKKPSKQKASAPKKKAAPKKVAKKGA